jgi:WD40 repeat protein
MFPITLADGRPMLITADILAVRRWDPATGEPVGEPLAGLDHHGVRELCPVPTGDRGTLIAVSGSDYTIRLWDPATGQPVGEAFGDTGSGVRAIGAVPRPGGSAVIVTAHVDRTVRRWDATTGQPVGEPVFGPLVEVMCVVPLADGRTLVATGDDGGAVRLWDPESGELSTDGGASVGHDGRVLSVCAPRASAPTERRLTSRSM